MRSLLVRSLLYFWPTHLMVVAGVAVAVAVLAGALLVGASVRASLRELALARLGATDLVLSAPGLVAEDLSDRLLKAPQFGTSFRAVAPLIALDAAVVHERSGRTAARVRLFGIDERFVRFHGLDLPALENRQSMLSPGLRDELGAQPGDSVLVRVAKPTDIPLGTLQGRRDEAGERIRLEVTRVLDASSLGEFSLTPAQGPTLSIFVPITRLQRDLGLEGRVNTLLIAAQPNAPAATESLVEAARGAIRPSVELGDLGLTLRPSRDARAVVLESRSGLLASTVAARASAVGQELGTRVTPALAYLANAIRANGREIPYSLVAAVDLGNRVSFSQESSGKRDPVFLNAWAAEDLGITSGQDVTLTYYLWTDESGLTTHEAAFTFAGVIPMAGPGGDPTFTPEYPGVTDAADVTAWDPPFPVDLGRVRPKDERYWDEWRTAPKAFLPLARGQALWPSPFGASSSLRFAVPSDEPAAGFAVRLAAALRTGFDPFTSGLDVRHARAEALRAAEGTTDFGEYFVYFSFFLVCSALLLTYLFFALNLEQRARELGLLTSLGFTSADLGRHFLREGAVLATLGASVGAGGAVAYAALILYGLRTWWIGAVGTTALRLHVQPWLVMTGALMALLVAVGAIWFGIRRMQRRTARSLLSGAAPTGVGSPASAYARWFGRAALAFVGVGAALVALGSAALISSVSAFFGAGACWLLAGLMAACAWLWRGTAGGSLASTPRPSLARLGIRQTSWRPGRSALSLALVAFACFVLVSVGAFRRDPAGGSLDRRSGTGGFSLMAESVAPLMHDANSPVGRESLALPDDPVLDDLHVSRFRLRPGDESSCLTLYRPSNPRIVAPEDGFIEQARFSFASSLAASEDERANPWRLLQRRFDDGAIPAIADQTSLAYVLHLRVGDDFAFTPEGHDAPIRLRIVGALADSVLQSELVIGEQDFVRLFPRREGYRVWFIETPAERSEAVATLLEDRLSDFGVDVVDTRSRLAAYHQVENTYLSTFQALGGLGLLIGTIGLAAVLARNVLERQRELGLLGAIGFGPRELRRMVLMESGALVVGGLLLGTLAAGVAIWPAVLERGQAVPVGGLLALLGAVAITGLLASVAAVRMVTSMSITRAIRSE